MQQVKILDINAYIDLSKYTTGEHDVEVKIENNDSRLSYVVNNTIKIKITNN